MKTIIGTKLRQEHAAFLLHSLAEHIPDAVHSRDQESCFMLVNHAAIGLFKLAFPDQAFRKNNLEVFVDDYLRDTLPTTRNINTGNSIVTDRTKT